MFALILFGCSLLAAQDPDLLLRRLASEDYCTRDAATRALLDINIETALPILARAVDQRDPEVQARARHVLRIAAERLCRMPVVEAAPIIAGPLSHSNPMIREWADRVRARLQEPVYHPPTDPDSPFGSVTVTIILPQPEASRRRAKNLGPMH